MRIIRIQAIGVYFDEYSQEIQQKGLIDASESDNVCAILI
jgi:hypothetical protein